MPFAQKQQALAANAGRPLDTVLEEFVNSENEAHRRFAVVVLGATDRLSGVVIRVRGGFAFWRARESGDAAATTASADRPLLPRLPLPAGR